MKKQGTVVSVHTIVDNNTKTSDDDDDRKNYSSEQFTEVVVLFGQAMRKAAFLHINKHIIIVAGVMRSKETASVHQELLASHPFTKNCWHHTVMRACPSTQR